MPRERLFRLQKNRGLKIWRARGAGEDDELVRGFVSDIGNGGKAALQEDLLGLGHRSFFLLMIVGGEDRVEKLRDSCRQIRIAWL
jgi:hypothetical protein